jgi:3-oxoacyl-[acyl-carrier protein] reductase
MKPVVVITGASGGIGKGITEIFLSRGYDALLHTHSKPEVIAELKRLYPNAQIEMVQGDLTLESTSETLAQTILKTWGRVDVLVNNAGLKIDGAIESMSFADFQKVMDVNLTATFLVTKAMVPIMKKQKHGSIINLGSGIGYQGRPLNVNYAASKAALIGLIPSLAKELGPYQIRVNGVAPGLIPTEMTSYYSKEDQDNYRESVPLKR